MLADILTPTLEMSLNVDTVSGRIEPNCLERVTHECSQHKKTKDIFLIDGE